jgi:hypothetical protein
MKILINHLDFIPSPFLVCFSSIGLSLPPPKEQRKRKTRKWVLGFFNTLSKGWEKHHPKIFGIRTLPK